MTTRADVLGVPEPHVLPGLAAVERAIDAVAPRRTLPIVWLAGANPNDVGIRRRYADVADRSRSLLVEDRIEGRAGVSSLPHAAGCGSDIESGCVAFDDSEVVDASAHDQPARSRATADSLAPISSASACRSVRNTIPEAARTQIETRTNTCSRLVLPELFRRIIVSFIASSSYVAPLVEGRSCVIAPGKYHRENGESSGEKKRGGGGGGTTIASYRRVIVMYSLIWLHISSQINRQERDSSTPLTDDARPSLPCWLTFLLRPVSFPPSRSHPP